MIKVRPFLTIHLDVDEMAVHDRRYMFILEAFPFHYMTPMARGITDAHQNGFVLH
jgi:hypothetical protein